jgi:hypothetical protein
MEAIHFFQDLIPQMDDFRSVHLEGALPQSFFFFTRAQDSGKKGGGQTRYMKPH